MRDTYENVRRDLEKVIQGSSREEAVETVKDWLMLCTELAKLGFNMYETRTTIERAAGSLSLLPTNMRSVDQEFKIVTAAGANAYLPAKPLEDLNATL